MRFNFWDLPPQLAIISINLFGLSCLHQWGSLFSNYSVLVQGRVSTYQLNALKQRKAASIFQNAVMSPILTSFVTALPFDVSLSTEEVCNLCLRWKFMLKVVLLQKCFATGIRWPGKLGNWATGTLCCTALWVRTWERRLPPFELLCCGQVLGRKCIKHGV